MVVVTNIRLGKRGLGVLSPLEHEALKILWKRPDGARVRDIHSSIRRKRKVALTSVAVILDRLHNKKIVTRQIKVGRGGEYYIYSCCSDRENFHQSIIEKTVNKLIDNFGDTAITYFNERFAKKKRAS